MIAYSYIQLEPVYWRQSLHSKRRNAFHVKTQISKGYGSILVSGVGNVGGMPTDLSFVRGAYDWKIPEGPPGSIGFIAYHPADENCDAAFIGGGCSINEIMFDDAWHRVRNSVYDTCTITLEVAPVDWEGEDALWNRESNKFFYIQEIELSFVRQEKMKEEPPPPKRGLFG